MCFYVSFHSGMAEIVNTGMNLKSEEARCYINPKLYNQSRLKGKKIKDKRDNARLVDGCLLLISYTCFISVNVCP